MLAGLQTKHKMRELVAAGTLSRLGEDAERLRPGLPWHNIRGIGNWLRHRYDRVDIRAVWNTVVDDLPPLRSGVLRALTAPPANPRGSMPGVRASQLQGREVRAGIVFGYAERCAGGRICGAIGL